jgi:hypothetical protein
MSTSSSPPATVQSHKTGYMRHPLHTLRSQQSTQASETDIENGPTPGSPPQPTQNNIPRTQAEWHKPDFRASPRKPLHLEPMKPMHLGLLSLSILVHFGTTCIAQSDKDGARSSTSDEDALIPRCIDSVHQRPVSYQSADDIARIAACALQ